MLTGCILGWRFWHSHIWVAGTVNTLKLTSNLHYEIMVSCKYINENFPTPLINMINSSKCMYIWKISFVQDDFVWLIQNLQPIYLLFSLGGGGILPGM